MSSSVDAIRAMFRGRAIFVMVMRFHVIAADHSEWPPVTLNDVLTSPEKYPEIIGVIVPEFASMKLLGEI